MTLCKHVLAAFLSFVLALCFAASAQSQPRVMDIVGTGDGIDVLRTVGASFMEQEKSIRIEVSPSIGSGGGIAAVGSGKAVLGRVARELTEVEVASGIVYKPIARLPSAFFVNPAAGVSSVTHEQLLAIYAGRITNWQELGGQDQRIRVVRRENADSTLTVLRASMPGWHQSRDHREIKDGDDDAGGGRDGSRSGGRDRFRAVLEAARAGVDRAAHRRSLSDRSRLSL